MSSPQVPKAVFLAEGATTESSPARRKLTPEEHWEWFKPHVRNWHGQWVLWTPLEGKHIQRTFDSIRSFRFEGDDVVQWNDRFDDVGDQKLHMDKGPWYINRDEHSRADGMAHPQNTTHRVLYLPNGDCVWVQPAVLPDNPRSALFAEFFFLHGDSGRFSVPVGYDSEKRLQVALLLEDALETTDRPASGWAGNSLAHHKADLEETRAEPAGAFAGRELTNTSALEVSEEGGAYKGFTAGVGPDRAGGYFLAHLPHGVTVAAPKELPVGDEFLFVITWLVSNPEIRQLSIRYKASGAFENFRGGYYSSA